MPVFIPGTARDHIEWALDHLDDPGQKALVLLRLHRAILILTMGGDCEATVSRPRSGSESA